MFHQQMHPPSFKKQLYLTTRSSNCSVTAALLSILKNLILQEKLKITSTKIHILHFKKNVLSVLVINKLNLCFFECFSWKMNSNCCFRRNVGSKREREQSSEHCFNAQSCGNYWIEHFTREVPNHIHSIKGKILTSKVKSVD